jgi:hypothetical protein
MNHYYVNKNAQANGDHEVHRDGCSHLPEPVNREYLGVFANCHQAVYEAKRRGYYRANGCFWCSRECNTG